LAQARRTAHRCDEAVGPHRSSRAPGDSGWYGPIGLDGVADNLHSLAERIGDERVQEAADLVNVRIQLG
jgi:hypothetical protein